jgi:uncharacterized membrane protein YfcA
VKFFCGPHRSRNHLFDCTQIATNDQLISIYKQRRQARRKVSCIVPLGHALFLFGAAFLAGIVNSVAGGGGFLTFPSLLFSGVPPIAANATSTAAVWPGTVASSFAYKKAFFTTPEAKRLLPPLLITGIIGGIAGAYILLHTPQSTFLRLVPWMMLGATLLFLFSSKITAWVRSHLGAHENSKAMFYGGLALELFLAIYIGYFGAGVGILTLALLSLLGVEDIHTMNGMKAVLVSVVNGVSLVIFIINRAIFWPEASVMIVAAIIGGYGGAYWAQRLQAKHVRMVVISIGFTLTIYFFIRNGR